MYIKSAVGFLSRISIAQSRIKLDSTRCTIIDLGSLSKIFEPQKYIVNFGTGIKAFDMRFNTFRRRMLSWSLN